MPTPAERAKRAHDHISLLHTIHGDDVHGRWIAIFLSNGSCDNQLYGSKAEAARFQLHETQCAYFCFTGLPLLKEMEFFLNINEELYDQGFELADPNTYVNPEALL